MGPSWGPKRPGALVSCTPKPPLSVGLVDRAEGSGTLSNLVLFLRPELDAANRNLLLLLLLLRTLQYKRDEGMYINKNWITMEY